MELKKYALEALEQERQTEFENARTDFIERFKIAWNHALPDVPLDFDEEVLCAE